MVRDLDERVERKAKAASAGGSVRNGKVEADRHACDKRARWHVSATENAKAAIAGGADLDDARVNWPLEAVQALADGRG